MLGDLLVFVLKQQGGVGQRTPGDRLPIFMDGGQFLLTML